MAAMEAERHSSARLKVLVVDDHQTLLKALEFALPKLAPVDIMLAESAADAYRYLGQGLPDCMIVDLVMPEIDGLQLIRVLRGDPETRHIPIIILSAYVKDVNKLAGMLSGADLYLSKPSKPQELVQAIYQVIALSPEEREKRMRELAENDNPEDRAPAGEPSDE